MMRGLRESPGLTFSGRGSALRVIVRQGVWNTMGKSIPVPCLPLTDSPMTAARLSSSKLAPRGLFIGTSRF